MVGHINRRRIKKRKRPNGNSKMKFVLILVIMVMAVVLGYLTARFIIGPLLGYDADESPITLTDSAASEDDTQKDSSTEEAASGENSEDTPKESSKNSPEEGYALQFGVFTSKEAADKLADDLESKGIETEIIEDDEKFKVISPVVKTKDEAIDKLNGISDKEVEDVFIASF